MTHLNIPHSHSFKPVIAAVKDGWQKVQSVAAISWEHLKLATCVGTGVFLNSVVIASILPKSIAKAGSGDTSKYLRYLTFTNVVLIAPLLEEIVFRGIIQSSILWVAERTLPDRKIVLCTGLEMRLPELVAVVASSILFGLAHFGNQTGLIQVALATLGGIAFGILAHKKGLCSSIGAHMTNNGIAFGLIQLVK